MRQHDQRDGWVGERAGRSNPTIAGVAVSTIPRRGITPHGLEMPTDPLSTQVFHILLSLVDDDLHGYAIIQDVAERTGGEVKLTASTLYAAIKRLLDAGWIEETTSRRRTSDDPRRRYYRLTAAGRQGARAEAERLERLAALARAKRLIPARR